MSTEQTNFISQKHAQHARKKNMNYARLLRSNKNALTFERTQIKYKQHNKHATLAHETKQTYQDNEI